MRKLFRPRPLAQVVTTYSIIISNHMKPEKTKQRALQLLTKLGEAHGAPGCEDAVRRIFRDELGENLRTDRIGNIICEKRGATESPRVMLAAHMDEVGFLVQNITKAGLIKFAPLGGWWPHTLLAQRVRIRIRDGSEIIGVIGAKPPHLLDKGERDKMVTLEEMFIDVGARDEAEVRDLFGIRLGDSIVPDSPFTPLHNPGFILCKAFDNRVGMALLIQVVQVMEKVAHPNTVYAVGTVQEEVGVRGAHTAVSSFDPDVAIVLEGAPADDIPGIAEEDRQGELGKGVQIRLFDPTAIMNRQFAKYAMGVAEENSIAHQIAVRRSGGTDAKVIQLHGTGVPTIVLGVPARYIHTHNSIIYIDDYLSALELVFKLLEGLDLGTVEGFTLFQG